MQLVMIVVDTDTGLHSRVEPRLVFSCRVLSCLCAKVFPETVRQVFPKGEAWEAALGVAAEGETHLL